MKCYVNMSEKQTGACKCDCFSIFLQCDFYPVTNETVAGRWLKCRCSCTLWILHCPKLFLQFLFPSTIYIKLIYLFLNHYKTDKETKRCCYCSKCGVRLKTEHCLFEFCEAARKHEFYNYRHFLKLLQSPSVVD